MSIRSVCIYFGYECSIQMGYSRVTQPYTKILEIY